MATAVRNRGAEGDGSITFRQNLEYPREPGKITYYPPEPSDDLKRQVRKEKAGGLILYIIGFAVLFIGYIGAMNFSDSIEVYAILIPILMLLGLIFAIMFLYFNNINLAKLSRAMPMILMICLVLLYIMSIVNSIMDLSSLGEDASDSEMDAAVEDVFSMVMNPAFFLMLAGLMICRAGGSMLWTSTKIVNEFIPGMIILETSQSAPLPPTGAVAAAPSPPRLCEHCSKPLDYIPEYQRYYCYDCKEYGPKNG